MCTEFHYCEKRDDDKKMLHCYAKWLKSISLFTDGTNS